MKILYFGGGLGNQIFEYAFYLSVKDRFPNDRIFGVYSKKNFMEHAGGFDIEKIFNVNFPESSKIATLFMFLILAWNKVVHKTSRYCHNLTKPNYNAWLFNAHKMNKVFYIGRENWISYKPTNLDKRNKKVMEDMCSCNSISLHVRRGDFFSARYAAKHADIATEEYYKSAIELVEEKIDNPVFFVFSDDIPWCKENLRLPSATYVDWNKGTESYLDMYLMKFAKANIIANSTFSYWGAYFNENNPLVIYPGKWRYSEADGLDIFPDTWVALNP